MLLKVVPGRRIRQHTDELERNQTFKSVKENTNSVKALTDKKQLEDEYNNCLNELKKQVEDNEKLKIQIKDMQLFMNLITKTNDSVEVKLDEDKQKPSKKSKKVLKYPTENSTENSKINVNTNRDNKVS